MPSINPFGRYLWYDANKIIQFIQFSPASPGKNITAATAAALAAGYAAKAASPSRDCIIMRGAANLKVYAVNLTTPAIT